MNGPFQLLTNGETELGPGPPGYLAAGGGRISTANRPLRKTGRLRVDTGSLARLTRWAVNAERWILQNVPPRVKRPGTDSWAGFWKQTNV
jgi:hypothetical protein